MKRHLLRLSCGLLASFLWLVLTGPAPLEAEPILPLGEEVGLPVAPVGCPHFAPGVAWFPDGGLVAVWERGDSGIVARFSPDAELAFGPEVTLSDGDVRPGDPNLAVVFGDGFLATWSRGPFQDKEIVVQRFGRAGVATSPRSEVTANRDFWGGPVVDLSPAGQAIVAWSEYDHDADLTRVAFRLYAPDAAPLSGEIDAAASAIGPGPDRVFFADIALAAAGDGGFLIAWARWISTPSFTREVWVRSFDGDGTPRGAAVSLSPPQTDRPSELAAVPLPGGDFLVGWAEADGAILVQRLDAAAQPLADAVRVDEPGGGTIFSGPQLAVDGADLVIGWERRAPGLNTNVYGREIDAWGNPRGGELGLNQPVEETWGDSYNVTALALAAAAGKLAAAWQIWRVSPILPSDCDFGVSTVVQTFSTRGPAPTDIPTLSGLGTFALALLLVVAGLRTFTRRRPGSRSL